VIDFHVDRSSSVPAYAQLVRQVREAMRMGLLEPGDQLPTVRSVVTSCTVNPSTVLKAYRELELSGLVEARQGAGTFVSGSLGETDPHVMARLRSGLARWLGQAREAGLEDEDVQALLASVVAEDTLSRMRAAAGGPDEGAPDARLPDPGAAPSGQERSARERSARDRSHEPSPERAPAPTPTPASRIRAKGGAA
jgi:GntR family transcriptional regulator